MGGTPPIENLWEIPPIENLWGVPPIQNHQTNRQKILKKSAGCGAGGQPDPRAGSRDAGAGGISFLMNFDDLFDDFQAFAWGGSPPPPFFDISQIHLSLGGDGGGDISEVYKIRFPEKIDFPEKKT